MVVRTCQADVGVEAQVEALLLARREVEVGLLVGRLGNGSKDLALALVRTPDIGGEAPARCVRVSSSGGGKAKKGGGGKSTVSAQASVDLDDEWVVEHARQVRRMLPGGIRVIGIYLFGPEGGFNQASKELASVAVGCVDAAGLSDDFTRSQNEETALLMYADSGSRRISMKVASADGALQPVELKFVPLLTNFVSLTCSHEIDISVPATAPIPAVSTLLKRIVDAERERVMCGEGVLPGCRLPTGETPVVELLPKEHEFPEAGLQVQLMCPLPQSAAAFGVLVGGLSGCAQGLASIKGCVHGRAYVHKRDSWSAAVEALRADVSATLQERLEMMLELEEDDEEGEDGRDKPEMFSADGLRNHQFRKLPRRVGLPWVGGVMACDYLSPGDTAEDAVSHGSMLLALEGDVAVEEGWEELSGAGGTTGGVWMPTIRSHLTLDTPAVEAAQATKSSASSCTVPMLMGVAAAAGLTMAFLVTSM